MKKILRMLLIAFASAVVPSAGAQQPARTATIGYLGIAENPDLDSAFRKGLEEHGHTVGKTVRIEYRYAGGRAENLPRLAAELVALKVALIVASSSQAIEAARMTTKTIPIVFPVTFDPVRSGYVASLARPGGNLTGLNPLNPEVAGKRVELLKEIVPGLSRVAVLWNSTNPGSRLAVQETEAAMKKLRVRIQMLDVTAAPDLEKAFSAAAKGRADAMIVMPDNFLGSISGRTVKLAAEARLPVMFSRGDYVEAGGLVSYGASIRDLYRRAAGYVDKILKGANPADLPVEQAARFELFINLGTAKRLGLAIPREVLFRADKVIE